VDIYLDASRLGIYPPLFTSPSGNSCILLLVATKMNSSWPKTLVYINLQENSLHGWRTNCFRFAVWICLVPRNVWRKPFLICLVHWLLENVLENDGLQPPSFSRAFYLLETSGDDHSLIIWLKRLKRPTSMDNMDDERYKTKSLQKWLLGFPQIEAPIISAHNV